MIISLTNAELRNPAEATSFSDLINQTKRIFEIIRLRKAFLSRNMSPETLQALKQEHIRLSQEEDSLRAKYAEVEHSSWATLRSFFIRFRFRLAELEQRHSSIGDRVPANDFMMGLDQLIQQLLQSSPVDMGRFLTYIFDHYRLAVDKYIRSMLPAPESFVSYRTFTPSCAPSTLSPIISPLLPPRRPSLYRVLSCNKILHKTWLNEGRINYSPLDIDPSLKEIYFFTRDQTQNIDLMYEEMMERNAQVQECIKTYKKNYRKFEKDRRFRNSQSQRIRSRDNFASRTKQYGSKILSPTKGKTPDTALKSIVQNQRKNKIPFGKTMFRIRPSLQEKSFRMSEPQAQLNETTLNIYHTQVRKYKRPATIKIQFKKISQNYV